MKPTLVITGGSGLLALNWAVAMRERFRVVLGLHSHRVACSGTESRPLDLQSIVRLRSAFTELRPAAVIHTAGLTSVEACETDPRRARHVNVELAGNVAQACAGLDLPLAHISTDHLFAGGEGHFTETHPPSPTNVYGKTKVEAEGCVLLAHPRALVIRTNFYGWGPSYRQSFSDLILAALRNRRPITLFRDVFYTPILSEALIMAVHELLERKAAGTFNVVADERVSKHEFGLRLAEQFQLDPGCIKAGNIADSAGLVERPREMSLSNEKICGLLGRKLGGVDEHIRRLMRQETLGLLREVQQL